MVHYHRLLLLKHKDKGDSSNYRRLLYCNKTREEGDDNIVMSSPSLLQLNQNKEGDGNKLL